MWCSHGAEDVLVVGGYQGFIFRMEALCFSETLVSYLHVHAALQPEDWGITINLLVNVMCTLERELCRFWTFGFNKAHVIYWLAKLILGSEEGLFCMDLVLYVYTWDWCTVAQVGVILMCRCKRMPERRHHVERRPSSLENNNCMASFSIYNWLTDWLTDCMFP